MWSRILDKPIAGFIKYLYDLNNLDYHNWEHVCSLYEYLYLANVRYDEALDYAVLFHDVVYDSEKDKEFRSAVFMRDSMPGIISDDLIVRAYDLILATDSHLIQRQDDVAIIKADLCGFIDCDKTKRNFINLQAEAAKLYPLSTKRQRLEGSKNFLVEFRKTMEKNKEYDLVFFTEVIEGIDLVISLAEDQINGLQY